MPRRTIVIDDGDEEQNGGTNQWDALNQTLQRIESRLDALETSETEEAETESEEELAEEIEALQEQTEELTEVIEELQETEETETETEEPEETPITETTEIEATIEPTMPQPEKPKPSFWKTLLLGKDASHVE